MTKAKSTASSSPTATAILSCIGCAVFALLFYLFAGIPEKIGGEWARPLWFRYGTYLLQSLAIALAAGLCLRNWSSPKIFSGRSVWLGLAIGSICWGISNLIFGYFDIFTKEIPFPTVADWTFITSYLFLAWGMAMSVMGRRLNLTLVQWLLVVSVSLVGLAIGTIVTLFPGSETSGVELDLLRLAMSAVYALVDVWMLIVATILLMAFSGGKAAQSWRLLAGAGIAMFIGDLGFNFAIKSPDYATGSWIEWFWVLAFSLFGMAAALEFDISSRATSRRRG